VVRREQRFRSGHNLKVFRASDRSGLCRVRHGDHEGEGPPTPSCSNLDGKTDNESSEPSVLVCLFRICGDGVMNTVRMYQKICKRSQASVNEKDAEGKPESFCARLL